MAASMTLFGREAEIAVVDRLIDDAHTRGGALVISGPPGIGKSALLAAATRRAQDGEMTILTAAGVQSEAHIAFAGLHQLLQPALGDIGALPGPQRDALAAAFGMIDAPAPSPFLTGLAVLELLAECAATKPVLVIADDAHWLDRSTAEALSFVARRLEHEPIALLAGIRDGFETPLGDIRFPGLALDPLDPDAAAALLDSTAALPAAVRQRVLDEAAGNPLALTELPVAFEHLGDRPPMPAWLPLTTRLEQAFAERLLDLPGTTRATLLVAALNDGPSLGETLTAGALLTGRELTTDALAPAVAARLVVLDDTEITFRHPLMRAAIASQASISQRQEAHAALAEALVEHGDRSVWHRAASVIGPDETVAGALEDVAERAERRGAVAVAIAALERAAELNGESARRAPRLLRAAELGFQIGHPDLVIRLVNEAETLELQPAARARLRWLRGVFDGQEAGGTDRLTTTIVTASALIEDGEIDLALKMLWSAAIQCWWSDADRQIADRIVEAAEAARTDGDDPTPLAILAFAGPIDHSTVVVEGVSRLSGSAVADADTARILGTAANAVGSFAASAGPLAFAASGLRREGRIGLLARALTQQAWSAAQRVELTTALPVAEEAARLTVETAQPTIHFTARAIRAIVAALRGDQAEAEEHAGDAEQFGLARKAPALLSMVQHARGLAALADRRYAEAYAHLRRMHTRGDPAFHSSMRGLAIADLVDAAAHCGQLEATRGIVAELELNATGTTSAALHAGLRYARPLMANDADAETLFGAAEAANTAWPFLRARVLLARGEWLRQRRRVTDSRAPLRAAGETFDALGVRPWGERARQQLRASGETSRRRAPETWDELTPQELQIVQLAAQGMTNREIGQMLYLSHRTIGSHLYRSFPKLGITSRAQLRDALGDAGRPLR